MNQRDDINVVAIRHKPLENAPEDLIGAEPVVIYAEQGVQGAEQKELQLAGGPDLAVGEEGLFLPPDSIRHEARAERLTPFNLRKIIFAIDVSSSMGYAAFPRGESRDTKLEYTKRLLTSYIRSGMLDAVPDAEYHFVLYDGEAERIDITGEDVASLKQSMMAEIRKLRTQYGTNISLGLQSAIEILDEGEQQPDDRNLLILASDGQDARSSRATALQLIRDVADRNTAVQLLGLGPSYDEHHIFGLAEQAGYSGWEHLPNPNAKEDIMQLLLEPLISDLRSSEYYLQAQLSGDYSSPLSLTPAIRRAREDMLVMGYQQRSLGILFQTGNVVEARLWTGRNATDGELASEPIPIIPIEEAAAHYEIAELGKTVIGPALYHLSILQSNPVIALDGLRGFSPEIDALIENYLKNFGAVDDGGRTDLKASIAAGGGTVGLSETLGTHRGMKETLIGGATLNPLRRKPESLTGGDDPGPTLLHSGAVGPLDLPPADNVELPPADNPNPAAYGRLNPKIQYSLRLSELGRDHEYRPVDDWGELFQSDGTLTIGRSAVCDVQLDETSISRRHCRLSIEDGELYIEDLGSRNGTIVENEMISTKTHLRVGATFTLCDRVFLYQGLAPKK